MKEKITLIATHINADLDGLASMLAAQKLYPGARVVFHHEGEKLFRRFFLQTLSYLFNMIPLKEIDNYHVEKIVLVDTRQKTRLGKIGELASSKDVVIDIYDHHERLESDLKGNIDVYEPVGANTTIMTKLLIEKELDITPEEATILSLGIYEDTGSFTFSSTTRKDYEVAGFLRDKGADLSVISNLLSKEISPDQLTLLNDMVESSRTYIINNLKILISTVSRDYYIPDLGFLSHKLNKMETADAVFIEARMEDKIFLVARSNTGEINIGKILTALGGGGHSFAGSATIKGQTLAQLSDKLINEIKTFLTGSYSAKDLMSSPPVTISQDETIEEASKILTRYNYNALVVCDQKGSVTGIIPRQVTEKAKFHNIRQVPVKEYMNTNFKEVKLNALIPEIQQKIIENRQRLLPVKNENNDLVGVLSRTDLLNHLASDLIESPLSNRPKADENNLKTKNISSILNERLPLEIFSLIEKIGVIADENNVNAFIVGGFVRDLMLAKKKNELDIDIVVEGDGIIFAEKLAKALDARVSPHEKFRTAVITLSHGLKIDVATARTEFYQSPAALPQVEMSSLKQDLYRRDFTINTLAVQLNKEKFGTLIDYFYAQRDLKDKVVRIIHNLSFVEDPTRIFRAIRFETRFGFRIGKFTEKLIKNSIDMNFFKQLSGPRVFTELKYILMEENPIPALIRIEGFGLFNAVDKRIKLTKRNKNIMEAATKAINWFSLNEMDTIINRWQIFLAALLHNLEEDAAREICHKFRLPPKTEALFTIEKNKAKEIIAWIKKTEKLKNSEIYLRLNSLSTETVLYMLSITGDEKIKNLVVRFFTEFKKVKIEITGKDLKELGFKPGPLFGKILQEILFAKMDKELNTVQDEFDFAKRYL